MQNATAAVVCFVISFVLFGLAALAVGATQQMFYGGFAFASLGWAFR